MHASVHPLLQQPSQDTGHSTIVLTPAASLTEGPELDRHTAACRRLSVPADVTLSVLEFPHTYHCFWPMRNSRRCQHPIFPQIRDKQWWLQISAWESRTSWGCWDSRGSFSQEVFWFMKSSPSLMQAVTACQHIPLVLHLWRIFSQLPQLQEFSEISLEPSQVLV